MASQGKQHASSAPVIRLPIEGMHCASCVGRVEAALRKVPGVETVVVNLATEQASVRGNADVEVLVAAVASVGYTAHLPSRDAEDSAATEAKRDAEAAQLKRDLIVAVGLTLPLFVLEMGAHVVPGIQRLVMSTIGLQMSWYIQFVLASLVLFGPGLRFFRHGLPALLRGAPDMNSLVVLGTSAAWAYSVIATFFPSLLPPGTLNVYYEAAAVIVSLILLGRFFEARARGRTSQAIKRLLGLQAKTARVRRDGEVLEIAIGEVQVGDAVEVRPGERIPVDGEVIEGESYVDESMISGEPMPVAKSAASMVIAGSINQKGALAVAATAVGDETLLAQIIRVVEEAQGTKLPIQALVDKVTLWFVPAVIAAALLTLLAWLVLGPAPALSFALVNAVAVLIIACPCAMGLATPTSIMVGMGRGAELGVLFRKSDALQRLQDARVVVLDKTGTLTEGKPVLTNLEVSENFTRQDVLARIAAVESRSEHPIAEAIVAAATTEGLSLPSVNGFEAITGFGVRAQVDGMTVAIGAGRYMHRLGLDVSDFAEMAKALGSEGKSPLYAAIDGKLAAIIAVADQVKASTPAAIEALHKQGLSLVMLTGDNRITAESIARQLGIDEVIAEVLPEDKAKAVAAFKARQGETVFVGDGINDAPALAQANVGIAVGTGTDIAIEAADVVLMSGNLKGLVNAMALSQATMRNIRQNLFWAFAYNAALIPVAAGVLYPAFGILLAPALAAAAMAFSSVFVLSNALRLRRYREPLAARK